MNCALCDFARALKCVGGADRSQKLQVANFSGEDHRCRHGRIRSRLMTFCPECPSGLQLLHPDGSTFVRNEDRKSAAGIVNLRGILMDTWETSTEFLCHHIDDSPALDGTSVAVRPEPNKESM